MKATNTPTITVLMPAYNCDKYIHKAITSILNQSFKSLKLIILDDSSTDNTWEIINKFNDQRIEKIRNDTNLGNLKCINILFDLCNTTFIAFQDADDWSHKNRLKIQLQFLHANPTISLCGTNCILSYDNKEIIRKYPEDNYKILHQLSKGRTSLFCGASIMFNKDIIDVVGNYNNLFDRVGAADIDWYIRALESNKGYNIQKNLYFYRQHEYSFTNTNENSNYLKYYSAEIALFLSLARSANSQIIETEDMRSFLYYFYDKPIQNTHQQMLELAFKKNITELRHLSKEQLTSEKNNLKTKFIYYTCMTYIIFNSIIPDRIIQVLVSKRKLQNAKTLLDAYRSHGKTKK